MQGLCLSIKKAARGDDVNEFFEWYIRHFAGSWTELKELGRYKIDALVGTLGREQGSNKELKGSCVDERNLRVGNELVKKLLNTPCDLFSIFQCKTVRKWSLVDPGLCRCQGSTLIVQALLASQKQ